MRQASEAEQHKLDSDVTRAQDRLTLAQNRLKASEAILTKAGLAVKEEKKEVSLASAQLEAAKIRRSRRVLGTPEPVVPEVPTASFEDAPGEVRVTPENDSYIKALLARAHAVGVTNPAIAAAVGMGFARFKNIVYGNAKMPPKLPEAIERIVTEVEAGIHTETETPEILERQVW